MGGIPILIRSLAAFGMIAALTLGCALPQSRTIAENSRADDRPNSAAASATQPSVAIQKLPFVGRLIQGDREELPPVVANSLADDSSVTFAYREQLTHDEYHIPLIVSALDPVTYVGAPLGDFGVSAFASLTIRQGDRLLGDYTAKAYVSKPYTLYSSPTHRELEEAARAAVRDKIDAKLARDAELLGQEVRQTSAVTSPP